MEDIRMKNKQLLVTLFTCIGFVYSLSALVDVRKNRQKLQSTYYQFLHYQLKNKGHKFPYKSLRQSLLKKAKKQTFSDVTTEEVKFMLENTKGINDTEMKNKLENSNYMKSLSIFLDKFEPLKKNNTMNKDPDYIKINDLLYRTARNYCGLTPSSIDKAIIDVCKAGDPINYINAQEGIPTIGCDMPNQTPTTRKPYEIRPRRPSAYLIPRFGGKLSRLGTFLFLLTNLFIKTKKKKYYFSSTHYKKTSSEKKKNYKTYG